MSQSNPETIITLPSRLRIEQRLGEISNSRLVQQELVPQIARLGGQEVSEDEFLDTVSDRADKALGGMTVLAYAQVPKIINKLIDDDQQRLSTMSKWQLMIEDKKQQLERNDLEVKQHHIERAHQKRNKKPRTKHLQPSRRT